MFALFALIVERSLMRPNWRMNLQKKTLRYRNESSHCNYTESLVGLSINQYATFNPD